MAWFGKVSKVASLKAKSTDCWGDGWYRRVFWLVTNVGSHFVCGGLLNERSRSGRTDLYYPLDRHAKRFGQFV